MKSIKKIVAVLSAAVVAFTAFTVDNNNVKAEESLADDLYYEIVKAPNQTEEIGLDHTLFTGQKVVYTGVYYNGEKLPFDCTCDQIQLSDYKVTNYQPEGPDDVLVAVWKNDNDEDTTYEFSDGKLTVSGRHIPYVSAYVYVPEAIVNEEGETTGYVYSDFKKAGFHSFERYDCANMAIVSEYGNEIVDYWYNWYNYGYDWDDAGFPITKGVNSKDSFTVKTMTGNFTVSCDNSSVAEVTKTSTGFTVESKKIGVAHITVRDDLDHVIAIEYTVAKPTSGNATKTPEVVEENTSDSSSNNESSSSNNSQASERATMYNQGTIEKITTNSAGETVRTLVSAWGERQFSLESVNDVVPTGSTIKASDIAPTADYYITISNVLKEHFTDSFGEGVYYNIGKMVEFDLADMSGAAIHQLDGYVTVTVDMPSDITIGENQILRIYRVADDGTVVACPTVVENGKVEFATNHFSTYVFVVEDAATPTTGNATSTKSPKTGE